MRTFRLVTAAWVLLAACASVALGEGQRVRVASYNIKFFKVGVQNQGDRLDKLKRVVQLLDADVIGLQEIDDRAALELLFPPATWTILIDDDSGDDQDVAIVVRKPLKVLGFDQDLDADDANFVFSGQQNDSAFPNRRDLLFAEVRDERDAQHPVNFTVMVHHAKSRFEGRHTTDPRREAAAEAIVRVIEQRFDDRNVILLGDMNDAPDDRSLNILETGDPAAPGGPEEIDGPFMLNLMERLWAQGHVSHGRGRRTSTRAGRGGSTPWTWGRGSGTTTPAARTPTRATSCSTRS
jgi:exonuclease III